ncbi:unnamed protein product [Staurois parvus]|uniref:Uncharacterized protein n=1 Tax=Staurois parvus TaxID=386267 RepID=A0ABN9B8H0_9NEOB|nr:unnamed protein product [Staurois parvus]
MQVNLGCTEVPRKRACFWRTKKGCVMEKIVTSSWRR